MGERSPRRVSYWAYSTRLQALRIADKPVSFFAGAGEWPPAGRGQHEGELLGGGVRV